MVLFCCPSFKNVARSYKKYTEYCFFIALHLYRTFIIWLHGLLIQPLETIVDKFLKHEPEERQWVQLYSLTSCTYTADFGIEMHSYHSTETYLCPMTNQFDVFMKKEYDLLLDYSVKPPKYDHEFDQIPEIVETLFVVRQEDKYVFRSDVRANKNNTAELSTMPEKSNIQFVIVEYKHPKMMNQIELKIPDSFYLVNNELLGPAFIQRLLELQRCYYVFDVNYEVVLIDDNMESQKLYWYDYVRVEKNSYAICHYTDIEKEKESEEKAEFKEEKAELKEEKETEKEIETEDETEGEVMIVHGSVHHSQINVFILPLSQVFIFVCCLFMGIWNPLGQIICQK